MSLILSNSVPVKFILFAVAKRILIPLTDLVV
jgi:hypothetical protein